MTGEWDPWTEQNERLAREFDAYMGVDSGGRGGRTFAEEDDDDGLSVEERVLADELDRYIHTVTDDLPESALVERLANNIKSLGSRVEDSLLRLTAEQTVEKCHVSHPRSGTAVFSMMVRISAGLPPPLAGLLSQRDRPLQA